MPDFKNLRPYQLRAAFAVQEAWQQDHKRVLVCHAVGTGKTHLGAYLLARWEDCRLGESFGLPQRRLWLAYTDEQIEQAVAAIEYWTGQTPAIEKAERSISREPAMLGAGIVVSSVQTLRRPERLSYFPRDAFGLVVGDECFTAGTLVDGRRIESIQPGDFVTSWDTSAGRCVQRRVLRTIQRLPNRLVHLRFSNGTSLTCTPNHKIWQPELLQYVRADASRNADCVSVGMADRRNCDDGRIARVVGVDVLKRTGREGFGDLCPDGFVYNLEVEGEHNYFANSICVSNCHHAVCAGLAPILEHFSNARWLGLSVGGESTVLVDDGKKVFHATLRELWGLYADGRETGLVSPPECRVRSFDGQNFCWAWLTQIVRHKPKNTLVFRVRTRRGRELVITEDHSVYVALQRQIIPGRHSRAPKWTMECRKGSELAVGDYLILEAETSLPDRGPSETIAVVDHLNALHYRVYGNFGPEINRLWPNTQGVKQIGKTKNAQRRWQRLRGKYGPYLTLNEYRTAEYPLPGRIGVAGHGHWCQTHLQLSKWAYFLGFYVGDGWTDHGRIGLAVEHSRMPRILAELEILRQEAEFNARIRTMPGQSVEILLQNAPLADALRAMCGRSASTKRVPRELFGADDRAVRSFIQGLLDSDGHLSSTTRNRARWYFVTTSEALARDLLELLKRLRVTGSLHQAAPHLGGIVRGRRIVGRHRRYDVHFSAADFAGVGRGHFGCHAPSSWKDAGLPVEITAIEPAEADYVYDLAVPGGDTFVANGLLVHNTATPNRTDEVPLGQIFDSVADHYSLVEGIVDGWLCRLRLRVVKVEAVDWSAALAAGELDEDRVASIIEEEGEALHAICRAIVDYNEGRPTLIYAPRVLAAEAICNLLASRYAPGAVCEVVSGATDSDQRRDIVGRFREGKVAYLSNCAVFMEGTDLRNASCLILARKIQSRMLFEQIVGRGLRGGPLDPVPGKKDCLLLDLLGGGRHKLTTAVDLLGGKWEECVRDEAYAQVYEQKQEIPIDVLEAVLAAKAQTEELRLKERQRIVVDIKAKVTTVDPFQLFPEAAADTGVAPTWWEDRLASEEQIERLKKLGIPVKGLTWLEAEKLLRAAASRRAAGLCSYKQARFLRLNGLDTSMSAGDAHDVMSCLAREGFRPGPAGFRRQAVARQRGRPLRFAELPMQYRVRGGTACQIRQVGTVAWDNFVTRRDSHFGHPSGREGRLAIFLQGAYELKLEPKAYFVSIGAVKTKGALR